MRFGVIGCGTVAGYGHIPALAESTDAELAALSDLRKEHLEQLGAKYGVQRLYTDYHELLDQPDIDAVTVATPVGSHYEVVMAALRAGKHVFCEKPLSSDVEQGKEMVAYANQVGKLLAVNFEMRAYDLMSRSKELIDAGKIGEVCYMRLLYNWAGPRWAGDDRHRMLMTEGKGPIFDCGVHFFDLARWFSGSDFQSISAAGLFVEGFENPDQVVATCKMRNGAIAVIDEGWVYGHTVTSPQRRFVHRIDIVGTKGTITTDRSYGNMTTYVVQSSDGVHIEQSKEAKPFDRMYALFARSIQEGRLIDLASGQDGLAAVEAAQTALQQVLDASK
ncbi:MAG TPA: Gfo/Idh/MocA family oxidoreductase [Firmicutes bacterium]|jgi:predicted dehydrogenase|nr:Gfo/Idh/MocA family oxidoreductase [Bacillota bacterium]